MTEIQRIVDQLNRAFEGGAWHGPAVMEILEGITPQLAATRPSNTLHSIWEITLHIAAWARAGQRRLLGDRAQLSDAEDWPKVPEANDETWNQTVELVRQAYKQLGDAISKLPESRLEEPILEGTSSVYVTLHGVIQHSLYHAGQIALLKKIGLEQEGV